MQELRLEDYRKGPTGGMVGSGLVGNQMGTLSLGGGGGSLDGGIGGGGLFGQQNKTLGGGELPDIQAWSRYQTNADLVLVPDLCRPGLGTRLTPT